jgi:hypothetical protein
MTHDHLPMSTAPAKRHSPAGLLLFIAVFIVLGFLLSTGPRPKPNPALDRARQEEAARAKAAAKALEEIRARQSGQPGHSGQ